MHACTNEQVIADMHIITEGVKAVNISNFLY